MVYFSEQFNTIVSKKMFKLALCKINFFRNFPTNVSIKLLQSAFLYLTIGHEGLGSTGSSVQSDIHAVI